jgi:hypothetical protein
MEILKQPDMKSNTKLVLKVLHVVFWILFIGICIKTGAIVTSFFVSLFINPEGAKNLYMGLDLANLYYFDRQQYISFVSLIIFLWCLKAYIFYMVIRIFLKINMMNPFSTEVSLIISRISYVAIIIGAGTLVANGYCDWLIKKGVGLPDLQAYLGGAVEFLLLGAIIFMISQVFKRGIEIQSENELTV